MQTGASVDFLILGGGTAGCVLAARLSENPSFRVTLVEAGADLTGATMAPHVRSRYPGRAFLDPAYIWPDLKAFLGAPLGKTGGRTARRYEQGRVLGGGSAINAMVANRGAPGDYDEWGALGAEGWSWDAALPYFRKLEHDADFDGPLHGQRWADPDPPDCAGADVAFRQSGRRAAAEARGYASKAGPERGVDRRGLCRGYRDERRGRAGAGVGGVPDAGGAAAAEPFDFDWAARGTAGDRGRPCCWRCCQPECWRTCGDDCGRTR